MNLWILVLLTIAGCYALKLVGHLLPAQVLEHRRTRRLVEAATGGAAAPGTFMTVGVVAANQWTFALLR